MENKNNVLIVCAHAADFVWRAGGTIAKYVKNGANVSLVILSYGARGECNDLWKMEGQTLENIKAVRKSEIEAATSALGVKDYEIWDFQDYFMDITEERMIMLTKKIREVNPYHIITHPPKDAFNPDHEIVSKYVKEASVLAISHSAGVKIEGTTPIEQPRLFGYEHHATEISEYKPDTFIDITDTFHIKEAAMKCFKTQDFMMQQYSDRAKMRANHARRISGNPAIKYAETFMRFYPYVGSELV
ncbi:MAG: LmbE family protein [Peptococcaceae bacterium BICA1-8]|nr:MAG: LmbE family protein [Peptococcaceae bacterium BICA1-8]